MATNDVGETGVVIERRSQVLQRRDEAAIAAQGAARQRLQRSQPGTFVRLGQDHVHAQQQGAVVGENPLDQIGQPRPVPRPAPQLGQRSLVDIDNGDPFVDGRLREEAHTSVVEDRFQPGNGRNLDIVQAVPQQDAEQQETRQVAQEEGRQPTPEFARPPSEA
ncbi:MAG: hypothetical protein AW10_04122 [Candidatus Accumulibacter appositus]|uniref:Uncharacterized protein n=1 Tax=Candidatus Accumulibacter appositus TaxID=1454003 RepID=A0A011QE30_9PROT|nr:MAG: hypothetical protein AW10_04122 [Candidatus Accumulibacter appositus]